MARAKSRKIKKMKKISRQKDLTKIAKKVFGAVDKNAYYLRDKTIKDFHELNENLEEFSEKEVSWLANWIDYLGDSSTANKIRKSPENFKDIISKRYAELKTVS